jgi:hypothetical protein
VEGLWVIEEMGGVMWRERAEGERPLERPRLECENDVKMNIKEMGWDGIEWFNLTRDRAMKIWIP